jgi:sigma-E factor negative regulatory protein RseB
MKSKRLLTIFVTFLVIVSNHLVFAVEKDSSANATTMASEQQERFTALEYLQHMQKAYKELNYELIYLNSLQHQIDPKQLIHGVIDNQEIAYFRYLNGAMRESLHFAGKTSYFEQGAQAYSLLSARNHSVFANIAHFDFEKGKSSYEYIVLGKGRIAGKKSIAIRMSSKDEYRYSYVIWLDVDSYLPLRVDTLNRANIVLEQVMVVSLYLTENVNPWLEKLSKQPLPELLHIVQFAQQEEAQWKVNWLPIGFEVIKSDKHKLVLYKNEPVSYIMLNDGIADVSIYIAAKKIPLEEKQKVVQHGATLVYTQQKEAIEVNVVGDIPVVTAKRLVESVSKVDE